MLLNEQLELLKGTYIKLGSKMSFFYCQKCDKKILETLEKIENKE